ncbi:pre-B-cell leukemia transcription factor-interacting protein 1 [Puma concolor]|uniref:Pre-B-cell leukemia transcription factor-interacting protein 1 n=1 Tax=Puma concolor TaxID=9696 RepID=A0A6P6H5G4_PUMCO|nr:pre-B-cell leukemia transcription factor-interacting protein 1 [Puma concolor]
MWVGVPGPCGWPQGPQQSTRAPGLEHPLPQGLPVETLGPESRTDPEPEKAPQAPRSHFEAAADELAGAVNGEETPFQTESPQCGPVLPEKTEAKGVLEGDGCATKPPGLGDVVVQRDLEEAPVVAGPEDTQDTQDLEGHSPPQSLPSSPNAVKPHHYPRGLGVKSSDLTERKNWGGEGKPQGAEWGSRKDARRQGPEEPPRRSGSPHPPGGQQHPQREEGASDGRGHPARAPAPWAELLRRKYRAPQGCSGVRECARQEGLAFGAELAPVRRQELASLLTTYLARLPWAGQLTQELPLSPAYFGEDGIFRHDRLRFRDFVDALEDSLEEVAVRQTGDDDEVDDFEGFIFSHFFGDKALKKRSGKKDRHFRSPGRG